MIFPWRCVPVSSCRPSDVSRHIPHFVQLVLVLLEHVLVLLRKQLQLLGVQLLLNHCVRLVGPVRGLVAVVGRVGSCAVAHCAGPRRPRLVQHALALLHLAREAYLHHVALEAPALLELLLQRPDDALAVRLDRVCLGLFNLLLWALCRNRPAGCPAPQRAQSLLCPPSQRQLALGCLPCLLGDAQPLDGIVELVD